jgi:Flp pilus assembly protein TadD
MTALFVSMMLLQAPEVAYADVSAKYGLGDADRLMADGKFLEAAVAYRNLLLQPGDREAVRVPFALALFATGDNTAYAGVELRRAQKLYPDFVNLSIDAAALFGSRANLAKLAERTAREKAEGDGAEARIMLAFVWQLTGDTDAANAALAQYVQARSDDELAKAVRARLAPPPKKAEIAKAPPAAAPPPSRPVETLKAGEPVRAGARFLESPARPRAEIFE